MANQDDYFLGQERFDHVMRRWVNESRKQLHDAMKEQHVYPYEEVWPGWKKESERREKSGNPNAWYSTGKTKDVTNVVLTNDSMTDAVIEFRSTMGLWYSELGVGLTGNTHVRGKRSRGMVKKINGKAVRFSLKRVKVQRDQKITNAKQRYVSQWIPKQGHTHRPTLRREMNLLKRRLGWAAIQMHRQKFTWFIAYQFNDIFSNWNEGDYIYQVENWLWGQKQSYTGQVKAGGQSGTYSVSKK